MKPPENCFDLAVRYLQGKSVLRAYHDASHISEGDLVTFSCEDKICVVVAIDGRRGYTFRDGKKAILRFGDLLSKGAFLGGASLG